MVKSYRHHAKQDRVNRPKRGKSGFLFFAQERRPILIKEHPNFKITQIASLIGKEWASLCEEKRRPYMERSEKDRQRYMEEKKAMMMAMQNMK